MRESARVRVCMRAREIQTYVGWREVNVAREKEEIVIRQTGILFEKLFCCEAVHSCVYTHIDMAVIYVYVYICVHMYPSWFRVLWKADFFGMYVCVRMYCHHGGAWACACVPCF